MAICGKCRKHLGYTEKKYRIGGQEYCYPCMLCSSCNLEATGDPRILISGGAALCLRCNHDRLIPIKENSIKSIVSRSLTNPLGTRVLLDKDESVKAFYYGTRHFPFAGGLWSISSGFFLLTSHRVIYVQERFSPAIAGAPFIDGSFVILLPFITGSTLGNQPGMLQIYVGTAQYFIELAPSNLSTDSIEILNAAMLRIREVRSQELQKSAKGERVQIVIDFSWLREYMEKGGLTLRIYKCPSCGASVDIPSEGKSARCRYCSNSFYAEDVFKKVKDLIG